MENSIDYVNKLEKGIILVVVGIATCAISQNIDFIRLVGEKSIAVFCFSIVSFVLGGILIASGISKK